LSFLVNTVMNLRVP